MTADLRNSSSMVGKVFCSAQLTTTAATAVFTCPALTGAKVSHAVVCNTTGSAANFTLAVVPATLTDDGTHTILKTFSVAANTAQSLKDYLGGCTLGPADFISCTAGTANALDIVITGTTWS